MNPVPGEAENQVNVLHGHVYFAASPATGTNRPQRGSASECFSTRSVTKRMDLGTRTEYAIWVAKKPHRKRRGRLIVATFSDAVRPRRARILASIQPNY